MLISTNELLGYKINGTDGYLGKVNDFYFDGETWYIRYMVGSSGTWLNSRPILISMFALEKPDWERKIFPVKISKEIIEKSPDINLNKPISREQEYNLANYFGWQYYWIKKETDEKYIPASPDTKQAMEDERKKKGNAEVNSNLRSIREITGYYIQAKDDRIGHVDDFILEDDIWSIRYILVDTRNWIPGGKKVLVAIPWIGNIRWDEKIVTVDLSRVTIENSPAFNPEEPINRDYEGRLHDYYGRPKYWW